MCLVLQIYVANSWHVCLLQAELSKKESETADLQENIKSQQAETSKAKEELSSALAAMEKLKETFKKERADWGIEKTALQKRAGVW